MSLSLILVILMTSFSGVSSILYVIGLSIKGSNHYQEGIDVMMRHTIGILSIAVTVCGLVLAVVGF